MTASGRMFIPKSRFNLLSAEPKGALTVRIWLLRTVNPLSVKTLAQDMGCLVSFKATRGHLSLIPPSLQAGAMLKLPPTGTTSPGDLHPVRCHLTLPVRSARSKPSGTGPSLCRKYYCFFGHLFDPPKSIFVKISTVSHSRAVVYDSVHIPFDSSSFWATVGGKGAFHPQGVPFLTQTISSSEEEGLSSVFRSWTCAPSLP